MPRPGASYVSRVLPSRPLRALSSLASTPAETFLKPHPSKNSSKKAKAKVETKQKRDHNWGTNKAVPKRIIEATTKGNSWPGWKPTPDRGLRNTRPAFKPPLREEKLVLRGGNDIPKYVAGETTDSARAGHLVECQKDQVTFIGVLIGFEQRQRDSRLLILSTKGQIISCRPADLMFSHPNFVPYHLAAAAGLENAPLNKKESEARVEIVKKIRELERGVDDVKALISDRLHLLYDKFQNPDPSQWGVMRLHDALQTVFGDNHTTRLHHVLALQQALQQDSKHFVINAVNMLQTRSYYIRPPVNIEHLETVVDWIRNDDPCLSAFRDRVQDLLPKTKALRQRNPFQPNPIQLSTEPFTSTDLVLIKVLSDSFRRQRFMQEDPYRAFVPTLMKRLVDFEGQFSPATTFQFLKDIGVISPWDSLIAHGSDGSEPNLRGVSVEPPGTTPAEIAAEVNVRDLLTKTPPVVGSDVPVLTDGLDAIRHDFGQMPVYTIDDASAVELDDGLSFEHDSQTNSDWVHVHVADPTSLLHPNDPLSAIAEQKVAATYFVERNWPMLPLSLAHERFSLGASGTAQPTMTFSLLIDSSGRIAQSKVRLGYVRNVRVLSYQAVDEALGATGVIGTYPLIPPNQHPTPNLIPRRPTKEESADLRALDAIAGRMRNLRLSKDVFVWSRPAADIKLKDPVPNHKPFPLYPTSYQGFPDAGLYVSPGYSPVSSPSRSLVEEFMIQAGVAAGVFAREHKLPFIYRTSTPHSGTPEDTVAVAATRNPSTLQVDFFEILRRHIIFNTTVSTTTPGPHHGMGILNPQTYSRVTSPLRRYNDLVNHWQIKSHLRNPSALHAFSAADLARLSLEHTHYEIMSKRSGRANVNTWALNLIQRALADPKAAYAHKVLSSMEARVMSEPTWDLVTLSYSVEVLVVPLGLKADIIIQSGDVRPIGDCYRVKVSKMELDMHPKFIVEQV